MQRGPWRIEHQAEVPVEFVIRLLGHVGLGLRHNAAPSLAGRSFPSRAMVIGNFTWSAHFRTIAPTGSRHFRVRLHVQHVSVPAVRVAGAMVN